MGMEKGEARAVADGGASGMLSRLASAPRRIAENAAEVTPAAPVDVALHLAGLGLPVLPCRYLPEGDDDEKSPLVRRGYKAATTDPATLRGWWRKWPRALPGVVTGAATGVYVVDIDTDDETGETVGEDAFRAQGLGHLIDDAPFKVKTPSGGWHLYYRHPGEGFGNTANRIARKVDTRGTGGYVIAPGAVGLAGRYVPFGTLDLATLPPLPDALRALLAKPDRAAPPVAPPAAPPAGPSQDRAPAGGGGFFRAVNDAALRDLAAWVPTVFPKAKFQTGTGAWRVSSADLGRALEEDLSLHPKGIQDFGEEKAATAIDVLLRWGGKADPTAAALWLCEALGLNPAALGWRSGAAYGDDTPKPDGLPPGFRWTPRGIWREADGDGEAKWLCGPLRVLALSRDRSGTGWGRLVEVIDADGRVKRWAIPARLFAGDGTELRATLLDMGLSLATGRGAREAFGTLLQGWRPEMRATTADRLGWADEACAAFVLGDGRVIGDATTVFQHEAGPAVAAEMRAAGTLDDWRQAVASPCLDNPLLIVGVSLAFAGALLEPLGLDGGGLHLRGASSRGKSTILRAAVSVWGSPRFVQSWRATANGLEGVAAVCNGSVLALDEIGEIAGRDAGAAAYMLANGTGKARANRSGAARPAARWRVMVLSSGEITLADKIAEAGGRAAAGQAVRLLDLPADGRPFGAFDDLHGAADGAAFADRIKRATAEAFGTAGPAFVAALIADMDTRRRNLRAALDGFRDMARDCFGLDDDGQTTRAVDRFGLIAAAGELATAIGLTGWPAETAINAALDALGLWLDARGGAGPAEARDAIARVRAFVTAHGASRFEAISGDGGASDRPVINRAGWRDADAFYIAADPWKEIHAGADPARAARHLRDAGLLLPGEGKNIAQRAPRSIEGRPRVYVVKSEIMGAGDD